MARFLTPWMLLLSLALLAAPAWALPTDGGRAALTFVPDLDVITWVGVVTLLALAWIVPLHLAVKRRTAALQQSMEEAREAHQRHSVNVRRMPLAYIVWDPRFRVVEWNPAAVALFGWSEQEAKGRHPYELIVPESAQGQVDEVWARLLEGDESSYAENENRRKDGALLTCAWYNTPLRNASGEISGVLSMVQDISERQRQVRALQTQFDQISAIFDAINAVVSVADLESQELLYLNRHGEELFGRDWHGQHCIRFLRRGEEALCPVGSIELLDEHGQPRPPCLREVQHTSSGHWFQCIEQALRWPDGRLARLEIAFDISEQKQLEKLKDEMISAVSHELRTPLTAILGYSEFLLENTVDEATQRSYLRIVFEATEKLNQLIDSFLALQRYRARQQVLQPVRQPIRPLLEAIQLRLAVSQEHSVIIDCPPSLPEVLADPIPLQQALDHLADNAVKYSPTGGTITLSARYDKGRVTITIDDRGVGIPPDDLDKIFEHFYRVDNSDRRQFGGTGLGLALVREIVQAHGGRVWAENRAGGGTIFSVSLPVADSGILSDYLLANERS